MASARYGRLMMEEDSPPAGARVCACTSLIAAACAAVGILALLLTRERHLSAPPCPLPTVLWSRGLMRACCDVAPARIRRDGIHERGADVDWSTVHIGDTSIVYVPSLDMRDFLPRFHALPLSARITVVTGQEDVGVPRELFGQGWRAEFVDDAPEGSLDEFLADRRLLHWFVQNYDLVGCTPYSGCSAARARSPDPSRELAARKVSPLPIGLDLHTRAEVLNRSTACAQQAEFDEIRTALPPFAERADAVLAPFGCRWHGRERACEELGAAGSTVRFFSGSRTRMWREIGHFAFVAAPLGHGQDTHRLWETLALGSAPVVLSSSLDALYMQFPVVILRSWAEVNGSAVRGWRERLEARFGREPFDARLRHKLTSSYWAGLIRGTHEALLGADAAAQTPRPVTPRAQLHGDQRDGASDRARESRLNALSKTAQLSAMRAARQRLRAKQAGPGARALSSIGAHAATPPVSSRITAAQ